jgi:P4 family phage/plasmid primase-like protien
MSSNAKELHNLLKENQILDLFFTHVSLIQPRGKFSLSRSILSKFWNLYCSILIKNPDEKLGLAEMPVDSINSIVVDIDLKFNIKIEEHPTDPEQKLYSDKFVNKLIQIYQDVLQEIIHNCDDEKTICVLLEKPFYFQEGDIIKNGFHLHFPHLFLSRVEQEIVIIPRVRKAMKENKYGIQDEFNTFCSNLVSNDLDQLIDTAALRNAWLLYGSRKNEEQEPYLLSRIIKNGSKEITLFDAFKNYKLYNEDEERICLDRMETIQYNLPRILSICPYGREISEIKKSISNTLEDYKIYSRPHGRPIAKQGLFDNEPKEEDEIRRDLNVVRDLLPLLSIDRADNRNDWMTMGWAIFNISQGNDEGLDLWIEFSKKSSKFNEPRCIYEWSHMEDRRRVTLGTIKHFAKKDSPEDYTKYLLNQSRLYMKNDVKSSHYDLAVLLHKYFGNEFVCTESGWYQYLNHHWEFIDAGIELRKKISIDLIKFFQDIKDAFTLERVNISQEDESKREQLEKKEQEIKKILNNLKSTPFKNNIMKECQEVFYHRDFEKKLNSNRYLIGFQNGIFDLEQNIFREGLPTDYISTQMPIHYREYVMEDKCISEINNFLEKVFPDTSIRRYFLDVMSETFVGYNHRKHVIFWTGEGDNGKSITQMFFEKMFGRLSIKAPTTLITSKRPNAGSANAELARAGGGVRTIFLEEPDPDEEIYTGIFKHLSGNDSIYTRDLYQSGKSVSEIVPMFKLFVICNKLPKIRKGGDKATWNRIRVIPFEATFSKNPPASIEEQIRTKVFPVDSNLAQRIPDLVEPFAWFLLQHRLKPKIDDPEKVIAATDQYRMKNDYLHMYANQCVVEEKEATLESNQFYQSYKEWLHDNISGLKPIPLFEFLEYFEKKWGNTDENYCWKDKRFCFEKMGGGSGSDQDKRSLSRNSLSSVL